MGVRITFSAIPAHGHVLPLVPLATAAAAGGHEVTFVASSAFGNRLPFPVVQGVPRGMTLHDAEEEAKAEIRDRRDPFAWPTALFGVVMPRHVVPRLIDHWEREGRPDLVVHEASNIGAAMAAARVEIPSVAFHIAMAPPALFLGMLRRVADFPIGPVIDPRPDVWRTPEEAPVERIPVRSVAWSDPTAVLPRWLAEPSSGPTAYLTLGTVAFGAVEVLRRSILEAAARCSRVLVAAGPEADLAALGDLPEHVSVERYVDQAKVLDFVDVAVHHGGTGTVLGCLAAGVPQVITPQGADQFLNADRLGELGLGYAVRNDAADGQVGEAIDRVLAEGALRSRVREVRDQIATMPTPDQVVETLVRLSTCG